MFTATNSVGEEKSQQLSEATARSETKVKAQGGRPKHDDRFKQPTNETTALLAKTAEVLSSVSVTLHNSQQETEAKKDHKGLENLDSVKKDRRRKGQGRNPDSEHYNSSGDRNNKAKVQKFDWPGQEQDKKKQNPRRPTQELYNPADAVERQSTSRANSKAASQASSQASSRAQSPEYGMKAMKKGEYAMKENRKLQGGKSYGQASRNKAADKYTKDTTKRENMEVPKQESNRPTNHGASKVPNQEKSVSKPSNQKSEVPKEDTKNKEKSNTKEQKEKDTKAERIIINPLDLSGSGRSSLDVYVLLIQSPQLIWISPQSEELDEMQDSLK